MAWEAERKDVQATFFWLLTMIAWYGYVQRPGAWRLLGTVALFAAGLCAKPMVMTLPGVLFLLDWWPLGRFPGSPPGPVRSYPMVTGKTIVLEKVPFLLLSAASLGVTLRAQTHKAAAFVAPDVYTSVSNALISYVVYLVKLFWPANLAVLYPYPTAGIPLWQPLASALFLGVVSVSVLLLGRRFPYLILGWFWYLWTLIPVIGFFQVGAQARADRYTYIPLIGVTAAVLWLLGEVASKRNELRRWLSAAAVVAVFLMTGAAFRQTTLWRDSITLYEHTVGVTEDNYIIHYNLGNAYRNADRYQDAIASYRKVLSINPRHANAYNNLGLIYIRLDLLPDATSMFQKAAGLEWYNPLFLLNLGLAYVQQGQIDLAQAQWKTLRMIDSGLAEKLYFEIVRRQRHSEP